VMRSERWHDTHQYPNRKSRRQAEFLVHQAVEWSLIEQIGVYDQGLLQRVQQILQSASHQPLVSVRRDWYY
ncbi:MAG: DarT ssDNA thymidine ADP-ribosyltransferase family protein, partial [Fimbriimonadales bacterium]